MGRFLKAKIKGFQIDSEKKCVCVKRKGKKLVFVKAIAQEKVT